MWSEEAKPKQGQRKHKAKQKMPKLCFNNNYNNNKLCIINKDTKYTFIYVYIHILYAYLYI